MQRGHSMTKWTKFCSFLTTTYLWWTTSLLSMWTIKNLPPFQLLPKPYVTFWWIEVIGSYDLFRSTSRAKKLEWHLRTSFHDSKILHTNQVSSSIFPHNFDFGHLMDYTNTFLRWTIVDIWPNTTFTSFCPRIVIEWPQMHVVSLSVAQLVTTCIFFSAWDKSRVKWDNFRKPIQK